MSFSIEEVESFLVSRWSLPIRRACPHLPEQERRYIREDNDLPVPKWARPQFLQRWLGQAIAARLAWQEGQPDPPCYRFGRRSAPCWSQTAILPYDPRCLRGVDEDQLLWYAGMDIERLYRIAREPQWRVGENLWTLTLLGTCRHLTQLYAELRRRCKAAKARELMWQALRLFVTWRANEALHQPIAGTIRRGWN